ncbi:outer membrane beta-barrel family protein [Mucilaginibacter jinjuensis]|uniref:Outer membrane beta-barrel family protein n=1 Tax=Mucilaginibacter jinjuensis TaxID=1176721 RepID=A0ABY7TB64_9SPHI|nr:outer membrane beta-barrel family protein [Mucilaginibacter jinjuensis]WCT12968.1 outer membrane beta-barrel family protein [Mucilaginibacter jinjuensis]
MKITISTLILCFLCSLSIMAQTPYAVKGIAADSSSNLKLHNTSVVILNAKDSTLKAFTRAGTDGSFTVNGLAKGKYILLLTYPNYADYVENFALDSVNHEHSFGNINLLLKSKLLADVIVKGKKAAIKIKGDTTEFNASSYEIQPNSKVEDLLKQLPGIQVDKDGKITAQGQTVNKVLVDGEEFFGDDPTLVTKNIRADMVDKVQLYDKKSDQATFTGIDDGQKTKTLNIKLKADKKNGTFGKADAGVGTDGYYQGQLLYNTFKNKLKFSAYGTISNTSKTGLSWDDSQKLGASNNVEAFDGGFYVTNDDFNSGGYNGEGLPKTRSGGLHFDNKWNADKESINTNYKVSSTDIEGTKNIQTQNSLPTGTINTNSNERFSNNSLRQKLDATYQVALDTTSNLKLSVDGTKKDLDNKSDFDATSLRGNDVMLNKQIRSLTNKGDQDVLNASAFYTKKFKKPSRTLSINLTEAYNKSDTHGYLNSEIDYYNDLGLQDSTQKVNQFKKNDVTTSAFTSNIAYTEPFSKFTSIIINYGIGFNNSNADRRSYNQAGNGLYTDLDSTLSNHYKFNQTINQGGAVFNYKKKKTTFNFGTKVAAVSFNQLNEYNGINFKRSFVNWLPQALYQYKFSQQAGIYLNYNGRTTQPTIDQINPLRVNTDPLNITLGNPLLKPSFRHSFSANYNSYKVLSDQYIYLGGNYSFTTSAIVNNTVTDSAGKSTYQAINLPNKRPANYYLYGNYGRTLFAGINGGININLNGNDSYNYVNNILNASKSQTYSVALNFRKYKAKKYSFYFGGGPNYTISKTSLQSQINNNGRGFTSYGYVDLYLPGKIQISPNVNYEFRAKTETFSDDYHRTLLNATISKAFLKQDNLKFSITGNDLLNQNTGFNRSAFGNQITQTTYTTIKRYFMFSITYDFNKMGGGAPQK